MNEKRVIQLVAGSVPDSELTMDKNIPPCPPYFVRGYLDIALWHFETTLLPSPQLKIVYVVQTDARGWVPPSVISFVVIIIC